MQAGLLRDFLTFKECQKVESASGFIKDEYVEVLTTRANKKRQTGKEAVKGHEVTNTAQLTFLLRYNPLIKESQIVVYNDAEYTIDFLDVNKRDKSIELRINRKDK